jgi:leucyl aminopeptidase
MKISIHDRKEVDYACEALILPFTENDAGLYTGLRPSLSEVIKRVFEREFHGKKNECLLVPSPPNLKPERILFIGLGKQKDVSPETVRQAGGKSGVYLRDAGIRTVALSTGVIVSHKVSPADFVEGCLLSVYKFEKYLQKKKSAAIEHIAVLSKPSKELRDTLHWVESLTTSVNFARDLINTPANDMTPSHLSVTAQSLRSRYLSIKILEKQDAKRLGMGAYLSVAQGSHQPAKFIILDYKGSKDRPVVLIGKSITFDSGGISLKPADGMEKMKYDMAGGAAVLGVLKALSLSRMPVHVIGILPATENLPGGSAARPGDVVRAINGKTIEIISTDAEGRMTLADAIGYAARYRPRAIIDIATLTGACAIAFGNCAIAMMGNDRKLLDTFKRAGENTCERVWEMPLFEECKDYLKSDVADLKNTGGKGGALLSSASFLSEFAGEVPWVHLDIAGTAWGEKERPYIPKGAAGVGVRLLSALIKELL